MPAWPDDVDEILTGDAAAGFTYLTPARGAVTVPMAPLGIRDREAGTVTVTSSLGLWKKLARVRANPSVAICYHAREHGFAKRPELVLVQGHARIQREPDRAWLESIGGHWERFLGPVRGGIAGRWLRVYYWERVAITVEVRRILVWAGLGGSGEPTMLGAPQPAPPPAQDPPRNGAGPRVDAQRLLREIRRLPHTLLAWAGGDGMPMVVPVTAAAATGCPPRRPSSCSARARAPGRGCARRAGTAWPEPAQATSGGTRSGQASSASSCAESESSSSSRSGATTRVAPIGGTPSGTGAGTDAAGWPV